MKQKDRQPDKKKSSSDDDVIIKNNEQQSTSFIQRTVRILKRVPILQGLCIEVFICQAVSSVMSYLFISTTKKQLSTNDQERARYTGKVSFFRAELFLGMFLAICPLFVFPPTNFSVSAAVFFIK